VVLDSNGRQITDLTADDFEIYQDDELQKIASSIYVREYQPQTENTASPRDAAEAQAIPAPSLSHAAGRRTIVFLIDDLSMSFSDLHYARMSLQKFVGAQMQPGDRVTILQTTKGSAGFRLSAQTSRSCSPGSAAWTGASTFTLKGPRRLQPSPVESGPFRRFLAASIYSC